MVYKPKNNYFWGEGFKPKVDANIVGAVFEKLEKENGAVTKEAFLDFSRPEESPTHSLFEWDDPTAAELQRLSDSSRYINHLRIEYVDIQGEESKVTAFVRVTKKGHDSGYKNIVVALQEDESREFVLEKIRHELENFIERNKHIEELADILINAGMNIKSA